MSDLLAKCDWDEGELHVYIAEWPEVVYVWVDEKTMPYAPVVADVRSLQAENAKLRELCRHLYACNQYCDREDSGGGCSACPYQPLECDCGFEERLLELGIEVGV